MTGLAVGTIALLGALRTLKNDQLDARSADFAFDCHEKKLGSTNHTTGFPKEQIYGMHAREAQSS